MIIIIDAYNLLHSLPSYRGVISDKERNAFIANIGIYGQRKGHQMILVFDGGPYEWPVKERANGTVVVYSGVQKNADEYIKEYVSAHKAQDIVVVSSDNELISHATGLRIPSIGSYDFYQLMQKALRSGEGTEEKKTSSSSVKTQPGSAEIDELMQEGSKLVPAKSEDMIQDVEQRVRKKAKLGKHERKLLEKLKKL